MLSRRHSNNWRWQCRRGLRPRRSIIQKIGITIAFLSVPLAASGHHSRVEFSDDLLELEGELLEVVWLNPHPALFLKVMNDSGDAEIWRVEAHTGVRVYNRMGVTSDLFNVGDRVRVAGRTSTRRNLHLLGTNVLLADDREVLLSRDDPPHWPGRPIVGTDGSVPMNETSLASAASENRGLFRIWSVSPNDRAQNLPYTDTARAGRAGWDPADNAIARCEQPGMPVTMGAPLPIRFIDDNGAFSLHAVYFDTVRTIHLDDTVDPGTQPATHLGYSVGRWDGRTLTVVTTRINYPYIDNEARTPQSAAVETLERFTLSEDQSQLDYHLTITDSATFTEPATRERIYLALDEPFDVLDCHVF